MSKGKQLYNSYDILILIFLSTAFTLIPSLFSIFFFIDLSANVSIELQWIIAGIISGIVIVYYIYYLISHRLELMRRVKPIYEREFFVFQFEVILGLTGLTVMYFMFFSNLGVFLFIAIPLFSAVLFLARIIGKNVFNMEF